MKQTDKERATMFMLACGNPGHDYDQKRAITMNTTMKTEVIIGWRFLAEEAEEPEETEEDDTTTGL